MSYSPQSYVPPKKKSGTSIFVILAIIGGLLLLGFIALICFAVFMIGKARSDSDSLKTIQATDGLCTVMVPDNWTELPAGDRNADASIQHANLFGERYVMVISDTKADIATVLETDDPSGKEVLKQFSDLALDAMTDSFSMQRVSNSEVNINGMPGIQHKVRAKMDGLGIVFWIFYLEGDNHFYQVQLWTLDNMESQNEDILLEVANSFRENR